MATPGPIAFLDSGIGGLPYLHWVASRMPEDDYAYVADTANFPYGDMPVDRLRAVVVDTVREVMDRLSPRMVVVACNTASVVALETLRRVFAVPFVGVVPAVKTAAERSTAMRIGLLATNRTVSDAYTDRLIDSFASGCAVTRIGDGSIVDFVENRLSHSSCEERAAVVADAARRLHAARVDTLVVGCTHFIYIEEALAEALGPGVHIVDSREGVGKQVMKVAASAGTPLRGGRKELYVTQARNPSRYVEFANRFGMEYRGVLAANGRPDTLRDQ